MKAPAVETIQGFAKRDDGRVMRIAMVFALGGALADIVANIISPLLMNGVGISMLWGLWIPLCFITIPPIHYLCRRVVALENRLESLGGNRVIFGFRR